MVEATGPKADTSIRRGAEQCRLPGDGAHVIAVDAFRLMSEVYTSGNRYGTHVVRALSRTRSAVVLLLPAKPHADDRVSDLLDLPGVDCVYPPKPFDPKKRLLYEVYWSHVIVPKLLRASGRPVDLLISPFPPPPLARSRRLRVLTIVHDLCGRGSKARIERAVTAYRHQLAAARSDMIVPISEATKRDFCEAYPWARTRVTEAVYNAIESDPVTAAQATYELAALGLAPGGYFVAFGAQDPRKGTDVALLATRRYQERRGCRELVIVTKPRDANALGEACASLGISHYRVLTGVSDQTRDALYHGATALLFPSRCEGFGFPLVEAMRQGCPPIAVAGGPALELVPQELSLPRSLDPDEWASVMLSHESMDPQAQHLLRSSLIGSSQRFGFDAFATSLGQHVARLVASRGPTHGPRLAGRAP